MGYHKDLGTGVVAGVDKVTGFPVDEFGHILDPISDADGAPVEGRLKKGTKLDNTTNPYGFLAYAVGSGDDFYCFDFKVINSGVNGKFIILHSVINSETGSFIQDGEYEVLPVNTEKEVKQAVRAADAIVSRALDWCVDNQVRHTKRGWNQDEWYFMREVARELRSYEFENVSEREMRFGSKRVDAIMGKFLG